LSESDFDTKIGSLTESAPGTDTASSGLNGRLQRIAQNITSFIAFFLVDNAGFTDGTSKVLPAGFILDETAGTALTENDVAAARIDSKRALVHVIEDATTRGQRAGVTAANALKTDITSIAGTAPTTAGKIDVKGADGDVFVRQATASNLNAQVVGAAASGASASGNPVSTGVLGATSLPTAVSNAQMVRPMGDVFGRLVVLPQAPRDLVDDEILTITSSTSVQSFTKSAGSTFYDIAALIIENKSSTGTEVIIYNNDGTTERCRFYVPATDTRGVVFQVPLKAAAVNVVWKAKTVTSVASVYITAQYVLNK
jgi:hypothetical protein